MLAFGAADNNVHVLVLADRAQAGALAHRLACSLHHALGTPVPFYPTRIEAIESQGHLVSASHYVLGQRDRHGVRSDPFLDASSLPDLLDMRTTAGSLIVQVREHLPRLGRTDLLRHLGPTALEPADEQAVAALLAGGGLDPRSRSESALLAAVVQALSSRDQRSTLA